MGKPAKDIDVVTLGSGIELAKKVANHDGENRNVAVFKNFGTAMLKYDDLEVEFVGARSESYSIDSRKPIVEIGTLEEDQLRRDFTINALFLDPVSGDIRDYVDGYQDLADRRLRLIGDPETRYREDAVRLLRAARFVAKLGVEPAQETAAPTRKLAVLLKDMPPARLFEEVWKLFLTGHGRRSIEALQRFGLSSTLFPVAKSGNGPGKIHIGLLLSRALENTDDRLRESKPVTPAFLFAALLWQPVRDKVQALLEKGESAYAAYLLAAEDVISTQVRTTAIPRRFSAVTRQIWTMQPRFAKNQGKRWRRLLEEQKFRAAYDFLLLRAEEDPSLSELCEFWARAQVGVDFSANKRAGNDRPRRRYRRRTPSSV